MEMKKSNMSLSEHMRRNDLTVGKWYRLQIAVFLICAAIFMTGYVFIEHKASVGVVFYYMLLLAFASGDIFLTFWCLKRLEVRAVLYEKWSIFYCSLILLWSVCGNCLKTDAPKLTFMMLVVMMVVGVRMTSSLSVIVYTAAFMANYAVEQICYGKSFGIQELFSYLSFYIIIMLAVRHINYSQKVLMHETLKESGKVKKLEIHNSQLTGVNKELSDNIRTDEMTGLGNRLASEETVKVYFEKKEPFTIAYVGLDYLKECNTNFGHVEGNRYILSLCELLKMHMEPQEKLFRIEGGRFLLISDVASERGLAQRLESAREYFEESVNEPGYPQDFSYGVVEIADTEKLSYFAAFSMAEQRVNHMGK